MSVTCTSVKANDPSFLYTMVHCTSAPDTTGAPGIDTFSTYLIALNGAANENTTGVGNGVSAAAVTGTRVPSVDASIAMAPLGGVHTPATVPLVPFGPVLEGLMATVPPVFVPLGTDDA